MQVIILAGGFGTRLQAVVPDLPKPMAPVAPRQRQVGQIIISAAA
jgi:D-glycero-alpha-D-manno-heptose 1-phosphate guanylyltransferase